MDSQERVAITGIRDSNQEGFIASTLIQLGWRVAFRATSADSLNQALLLHPEAAVLLSDDFMGRDALLHAKVIFIQGRTRPVADPAMYNPSSDYDLSEIMRDGFTSKGTLPERITPAQSNLILFLASSGGIGTSTLALNFAAEISLQGQSVLLVDAHLGSSFISRHLALHRIDQKVLSTQFGFSIAEINSRESLERVNHQTRDFEVVVLDLGLIAPNDQFFGGRRAGDVIQTWALESAGHVFFSSSKKRESISASYEISEKFRQYAPHFQPRYPVVLDSTLSRRERDTLVREMSMAPGHSLRLFSRDRRAVEAAERDHSTLAASGRKSLLRSEIISSVNRDLNLK